MDLVVELVGNYAFLGIGGKGERGRGQVLKARGGQDPYGLYFKCPPGAKPSKTGRRDRERSVSSGSQPLSGGRRSTRRRRSGL